MAGRPQPTGRPQTKRHRPTQKNKKAHRTGFFLADTHLAHWQVAPSSPTTQTCQRAKFSNRTQTLSRTEKQNEPYSKAKQK